MGHQIYVLLCSKMAGFPPSEGQFSEKSGIFSKVKIFQNPSCCVLLCSEITSFQPSEGEFSEKS